MASTLVGIPSYRLIILYIVDIHNMMNIKRRILRDDEQRFIQEIASLLAPRGLPPTAGRLYGYLLLSPAPVSLDQIAADLEMSKGGAWNAARMLERCGTARRYGQPGSKRALYGPPDDFTAPLSEQSALFGAIGTLLQTGAATVASDDVATRLKAMSQFYLSMRRTMDTTIAELNATRARAG